VRKLTPEDRAFIAKYRDNPSAIAKYLNDALATGDPVLITKAIGAIMRAQGVPGVAQKVGQRRDSLYRMFRGEQSATLNVAIAVLLALDMQLIVKPSAPVKLGLKAKGK
jgi:probable addiction module antidote protein